MFLGFEYSYISMGILIATVRPSVLGRHGSLVPDGEWHQTLNGPDAIFVAGVIRDLMDKK